MPGSTIISKCDQALAVIATGAIQKSAGPNAVPVAATPNTDYAPADSPVFATRATVRGAAPGAGGDRHNIQTADGTDLIKVNNQGSTYHRIDQTAFYNAFPGGVYGDNASITLEQTTQGSLSGQPAFRILAGNNGVYRYIAGMLDNGAYETGAYINLSNSRNSDGSIQSLGTSNDTPGIFEPHMMCIWPDVNGTALKIAGNTSGGNIGYCLSFYNQADLDPNFPGGAYSSGTGKKYGAIGPKMEMLWGTNLGTTPATTYIAQLSLDTTDNFLRVDGNQKVVKRDNGADTFFVLYSNDRSVGLGMTYAGLQATGTNTVADLSLDSKGNGSYIWLGRSIFSGLRVGADDASNTLWNGARDLAITANSGQTISLGQVSASTSKGIKVATVDGRSAFTAPPTAPSDSLLSVSQVSFYLDEATNTLRVRVRYSDGTTLKTGQISLT